MRQSDRASSRHPARGFTLVELLVVIGIIAVLISILLPVLGRVREKANAIKCMANLRSLGQAMAVYVTQTRHYPAAMAQRDYAIWPTRLRAVLGGNQAVFYCPSRPQEYEWTPAIYLEPTVYIGEPGFGYYADEMALHGSPFSYGYNGWGTDVYIGDPFGQRGLGGCLRHRLHALEEPFTTMRELSASRVRVPSDMIAITDSGPYSTSLSLTNCFMVIPIPPNGYGFGPPARVHAGGANVLFCDGHVQWYPADDLMINDLTALRLHRVPATFRDQQIARMWNSDHEP